MPAAVPPTDEAPVRLRVLGAVEAHVDGARIDIGPARQQCVLAALLLDAGRPVSVDQLVDRVWGHRAPERAVGTLHSYLTRIRQALTGIATITRRSGSYVLTVDEPSVDLHRFRALVARARESGDPELFERALGLWRGEAFAGLDTPWLAMVREQLDRERLAAELDRNDVVLALGRYAEVLPQLRSRTAEQPLDERLAGQLMLALYHSGRQADALEHFDRTRRRLTDELGSDPSPRLRRLHEAILRGQVDTAEPEPKSVARNDLPGDLADFTGRDAELRHVLTAIPEEQGAPTAVVIEAIDGMAGVGKTTLAVHLAHLLVDRYPDAQLFVDLQGHAADRAAIEPSAALETLLRALGVPGERIPADLAERSALWRAELAGRRAIVVLDNAADSSQVRPLLPGTSRALTLITSRRRLLDLETARVLSLDLLPHRDAVALFGTVVGDARPAREPDAVDEVVELCGRLPLALRIAAARLRSRPSWTVSHLARRLRQGLSELSVGDRSVAAAFALSYDHLADDQRRLFRLLGLVPGADFDAFAAAALTGVGVDEADRLLEELVDVHLLDQPTPSRYRFHDLLRDHALAVALETESEEGRAEALARLLDYHLHTATAAGGHLGPSATDSPVDHPPADAPTFADGGEALTWLDAEHANLVAAVLHAAEHGPRAHSWRLTRSLWRFYFIRGHVDDWITTHHAALRAATAHADPHARAEVLKCLGTAHWQARRLAEALEHYQGALALFREVGDRKGEAAVLGNLGLLYDRMGRYQEAVDHHRQDLDLCRLIGDRRGEGTTLSNLGLVCERLGRYDEAFGHCREALVIMREFGDRWSEGETLIHLGIILHRLGRPVEALEHQREALVLMRELADRDREGQVLANIGTVLSDVGEHTEALEHLRQALAITRETGDRTEETSVLNDFGEAHRAAGQPSEADHQRALTAALDIGDRHQQARAHLGLGHAVVADDPEAARLHWELSLTIFQELGVPEADQVATHLAEWSTSDESA